MTPACSGPRPNPMCQQVLARLPVKCLPPAPLWSRQEGSVEEEGRDLEGLPNPLLRGPILGLCTGRRFKIKAGCQANFCTSPPTSPAFGGWAIFRKKAGRRQCLIHPGG